MLKEIPKILEKDKWYKYVLISFLFLFFFILFKLLKKKNTSIWGASIYNSFIILKKKNSHVSGVVTLNDITYRSLKKKLDKNL